MKLLTNEKREKTDGKGYNWATMDILYHFTQPPLARCHITQPFGANYVDFYKPIGLLGHNGIDFSAPVGTPIFAVADGFVEGHVDPNNLGYGISVWLYVYIEDDLRLEIVSGHCSEIVKTGNVKKGDVIALSGNTGKSTGPHVHFGVRPQVLQNGKWTYDAGNGYSGCVDPEPMFDHEAFMAPAELRYGQRRDNGREYAFLPSYWWMFSKLKRLLTTVEYNALLYGYWDYRTVMDPACYWMYSEMTKPEAQKRKLIP